MRVSCLKAVGNSSPDADVSSPIHTYGTLGCTILPVSQDDHGIIYDKGSQPALSGEPEAGVAPICFDPWLDERIGEEAGVDYGDLVPVDHDVDVIFIGTIICEDWPIVRDAVDSCRDREKALDRNKNGRRRRAKRIDTDIFGVKGRAFTGRGPSFRKSLRNSLSSHVRSEMKTNQTGTVL